MTGSNGAEERARLIAAAFIDHGQRAEATEVEKDIAATVRLVLDVAAQRAAVLPTEEANRIIRKTIEDSRRAGALQAKAASKALTNPSEDELQRLRREINLNAIAAGERQAGAELEALAKRVSREAWNHAEMSLRSLVLGSGRKQ